MHDLPQYRRVESPIYNPHRLHLFVIQVVAHDHACQWLVCCRTMFSRTVSVVYKGSDKLL